MRPVRIALLFLIACAALAVLGPARSQAPRAATPQAASRADDPCARPPAGSDLPEPVQLRSEKGELRVRLSIRNSPASGGIWHYCYVLPDGSQAPTLRLHPGDLLVLQLKNELQAPLPQGAQLGVDLGTGQAADMPGAMGHRGMVHPGAGQGGGAEDPCTSGAMTATATNLHFHGMTMPPLCHQDDVLRTSIASGAPPFEYRFRIPADEPPGLYWYHPHIHGFSSRQVAGGASGALIVEGLERAVAEARSLPERVIVIRDQELVHPDAVPAKSEPVVPRNLVDSDGDVGNNGTGFGKPSRDLSLNYVPVPFPNYPAARLRMKPGERQLWRVLNASSVTYLQLAWLFDSKPQPLGVVAIDGVPLHGGGAPAPSVAWTDHIGIAPGGRAEFLLDAPAAGAQGRLVTRWVDTGPAGENDPNRVLLRVLADVQAPAPQSRIPDEAVPLPAPARPWLGDVTPKRVRKFIFSERPEDPQNPKSPMQFFITPEGQTPAPFNPMASEPDVIVHQGDVEDWIIENRSKELHAFHIHQTHFQLVGWSGTDLREPFLRDTVNVPYYNGHTLTYPSVRLRMDFRDPDIVGTFVYHCHLLDHEDAGMMGVIRVDPALPSRR